MQVSAITSSSLKFVSKVRGNSLSKDCNAEAALVGSSSFSREANIENRTNLFDSINEWKYFCHAQIEKGNFDVVV